MNYLYFCIALLFTLCSSSPTQACLPTETEILLNLIPDNWGSEITWQLTGVGGTPVYASGGPYTDNNTTPINVSICVPTGTQVIFTISDSYGDGICCSNGNGSYTLTVNVMTAASGGSYGSSESSIFFAPLLAFDVMMEDISSPFPLIASNEIISIKGSLSNTSSTTINALSISYQVGTEPVVTESFSSLNIAPSNSYDVNFATMWTATNIGVQEIRMWLNDINGGNADMFHDNDTLGLTLEVYQAAIIPNRMADFLAATPIYTTIATSANQVNKPTDLDFHPVLDRNELWVLNENTEASGGSTVTISDPGLPTQSTLWLRDGNAYHFMSLPTALAFGTNGNWATSPGVFDANHNGGAPFTGPALWSSNMSIYAQNAGPGTNGSHLDMLHQSPYAMGITHDKDNAYWVVDGNSSDIVYYNFGPDHGPGQSYHDDGIIRRYPVSILKDADVPSHLILNKATGWLYIVNTGNDRVLRMNTSTGTVQNALTGYEAVAEYSQMTGVVSQTVIDTGLTRPSGIELVEDRLLVGDYTSGDIRIYDISVNPALYLGKLATGAAGLTGIKVGPTGDIWFTNRLTHQVRRITPSVALGVEPLAAEEEILVFPNPATEQIQVRFPASFGSSTKVQIVDALGRIIVATTLDNKTQLTFNCSDWAAGVYMLNVQNEAYSGSKMIQVR